jgi:hypothetical protein
MAESKKAQKEGKVRMEEDKSEKEETEEDTEDGIQETPERPESHTKKLQQATTDECSWAL